MRYNVTTLQRYNGVLAEKPAQADRPFQTFESLEAYQVACEFREAMYVASRRLPDFEKFELASQIRRAAASLTNNLAEGHGRLHYPDQVRFLLQSRGSLEELLDGLNVCLDENYLPAEEVASLKQLGLRTLKVINGYGRFLRRKKAGQTSTLHETNDIVCNDGEEVFADVTL